MKQTIAFLLAVFIVLIFSGCDMRSDKPVVGSDYLLAGYYMMAGEKTALADEGTSRATAPAWWASYNDYTYDQLIALGADGLKINNYPEQGQKTYITVTAEDAAAKVYKISSPHRISQ